MPATTNRTGQQQQLRRRSAVIALGMLCVITSFSMGVRTAGEVHTVDSLEAANVETGSGDMDANGTVDASDAVIVLEIVREYRTAQPQHYKADPNRDGRITVDDALHILHSLPTR